MQKKNLENEQSSHWDFARFLGRSAEWIVCATGHPGFFLETERTLLYLTDGAYLQ